MVPNPFEPRGRRSLWTRWQLAIAGWKLFISSGGIGVGLGSVQAHLHALSMPTGRAFVLHSWLFYLLSAFGVVGVGLFLTAYARLLYDLAIKTINTNGALYLGLFAALLALPVGAMGPSNAVLTRVFWAFLGLAAVAVYRTKGESDRPGQR